MTNHRLNETEESTREKYVEVYGCQMKYNYIVKDVRCTKSVSETEAQNKIGKK